MINYYEGSTLEEVRAYRELESETFDFGEGEMRIEGWYGSEDAYYEMALEDEEYENDFEEEYLNKKKRKKLSQKEINSKNYHNKFKNRTKLKKLNNYRWYLVRTAENGTLHRCYRGSGSKYLKKISNKKVRKYDGLNRKNCDYRRVFDFWYSLF